MIGWSLKKYPSNLFQQVFAYQAQNSFGVAMGKCEATEQC